MDAPPPARRPRRTVLFCPGSRPDRFSKAAAAGADAICLDLEDGVAPAGRNAAREAISRWLSEGARATDGSEVVVRVNDPGCEAGRLDLEMLRGLDPGRLPDALMVPKVDGPEPLIALVEALGSTAAPGPGPTLLPLIETAMGLHRVEEVARARLPLGALVFGGMDLAAELGASFEWEPLLHARSRIVHAAALAGVGAIDAPWTPLDDPHGLLEETRRVGRLGFTGKLAIHPTQIDPIHRALAPDEEELAAARRIVAAARGSEAGVVVVDGRMVDRPAVLAAERILARAGPGKDRTGLGGDRT